MSDLIRYEFKKIVGSKAGMVACALALLVIVGITVLDAVTTRTYDQGGRTRSGVAGLEAYRERQTSHAGVLDADRVAADLAAYDHAEELAAGEEPGFSGMSGEQVIESYGLDYWRDTYAVLHDAYYTRLHDAMLRADGTYAPDLERAAAADLEGMLRDGLLDYYPYSDAEKGFWRDKASQVEWPLEYGNADGWVTAFNWTTFLALPIVGLCVALSGVFGGEYRTRAASVVLPTRLGKGALPLAKAAASLLFATAYWWACVVVMLAVIFALFGMEGADRPFQQMGFTNPYPLTMAGATALRCMLGYVIALGMAGITLLLSAKARSSMPATTVPMAVVLLGLIGIFITPTAKVAALTPLSALTWSFSRAVSYASGPVAADLPTVACVLYTAALLVCMPLAMRSFGRHQVA